MGTKAKKLDNPAQLQRGAETMKAVIFGAMLALISIPAQAACYGSSAFESCNDTNGNSYTVQRYGNTTHMQGYNSRTGSNWSQNSHRLGNSTYTNGMANGRSWNMRQNSFGSARTWSGTDSHGNSFSGSCFGMSCD